MLIGRRAGDARHVVRRAGDVIKRPRDQQLVLDDVKGMQGTVVGCTCVQSAVLQQRIIIKPNLSLCLGCVCVFLCFLCTATVFSGSGPN